MKDMFSMYYQPTDEEFKEIWANCIFVFDANVLLNLYRYTKETREQLLNVLERFKDRIWIPHQVGLEYHSNRHTVILEQKDAYGEVKNAIGVASQEFINQLKEKLKKYKKRHPTISVKDIMSAFEKSLEEIILSLEKQEGLHPNLINEDVVINKLIDLFNKRVGEPYTQDVLNSIYDEGKDRYEKLFPPGFKDLKDKQGKKKYFNDLVIHDEYGDLIVWKQIIDKAKQDGKPIVFVTDDTKDDWWRVVRGRTLGPRLELVNEFKHETRLPFYMYQSDRFIEYAQGFLEQQINHTAIKEMQDVRESNKEGRETLVRPSNFEFLTEEDWKAYERMVSMAEKKGSSLVANELYNRAINWATVMNKMREREMDDEINELLGIKKNNDEFIHSNRTPNIEKKVDYNVGEEVFHTRWGVGNVIDVEGQDKETVLHVLFPEPVGMKQLLAYFSPLQKNVKINT